MLMCREELLKKAQDYGVTAFEFAEAEYIDILLKQTISDFLNCFLQESTELFYRYTYLPNSKVMINGDTLCEIDSETRKQLKGICPHFEDMDWCVDEFLDGYSNKNDPNLADYINSLTSFEKKLCGDIVAYNKTVDHEIIDRPIKLEMFVIFQGKLVGVCEEDNWDAEILPASKALQDILESNEEGIKAVKQELRKKQKDAEKRLQESLGSCAEFLNCTSKDLRKQFAKKLWDEPEFEWLHDAFSNSFGYPAEEYYYQVEMAFKRLK